MLPSPPHQSFSAATLLAALLLLGATPAEARRATVTRSSVQPPRAVSLAGAWKVARSYDPASRELPSEGELPVPSNWYRQGWQHDGTLWFVRRVTVPPGAAAWRVELDGVDYHCAVFWDGVEVGRHTGYFAPFSVAVPSTSGEHLLAVKVDSPRESTTSWSLHKTLIKGVLSHHDTRPGGAWSADGQDANTGGIWGDVRLAPASTAWIDRPRATTLTLANGRAELELTAEVAPVGASPARVRWQILSPRGLEVAAGAWTGNGRMVTRASLASPELWWPRGWGAAPLYTLVVSAGADRAASRFGIRTVRRDDSSRYLINGVPVLMRGTNYIGSLYLSALDRATVGRDLELMLRAHINAVRVHAHVTSPAFYDLADELGMLIWQDFPLQWGYSDAPEIVAEASRQLGEMLASLGGHPSIIHWTAQNEAPWSSEWMVYKYPLYDPDQNRALSAALARVLATDPSRPSQVNSGTAEHAWMGWYSGSYRDFARPQAHPVLTELGAQALPELATLRTFLRQEQLWPLEPNLAVWEYHNFQKRELTEIAKIPIGTSLPSLIARTQEYQARLIQFAVESLRRQAWQPITGIFQFMFVEHWPSMSWGIVDYLRRPKPGYAALQRAFQPVLPIAYAYQKDSLRLHIANDRPKAQDVLVLVTREVSGKPTYRRRFRQTLRENGVTIVDGTFARPAANEALRIAVADLTGAPISENFYAAGSFTD